MSASIVRIIHYRHSQLTQARARGPHVSVMKRKGAISEEDGLNQVRTSFVCDVLCCLAMPKVSAEGPLGSCTVLGICVVQHEVSVAGFLLL
jgi:hypothetical protein